MDDGSVMKMPNFVAMTTINKEPKARENDCTDWVATEKVHGSSFQFFTNDGVTVYLGSRRNVLDRKGSFLKCNLEEFHRLHFDYVKRMYSTIQTDERWLRYRTWEDASTEHRDENDNDVEEDEVEKKEDRETLDHSGAEIDGVDENSEVKNKDASTQIDKKITRGTELRIYGELYGGGGVHKDIKPAVQKEIIYADDFRFYAFGITVNRKWMTVVEMNDLCRESGFPYYATPVCDPKPTLTELIEWLTETGFMLSNSRLTERTDDFKTKIEGVVMTPLTRRDFRMHPIKMLSSAFNDVRQSGKGSKQKLNYCTKARYHSVISKLDLHEREDVEMVAEMFIADIMKESGETQVSIGKRKSWTRLVRTWLAKDGYIQIERDQGAEAWGGCDRHDSGAMTDANEATLSDISAHEDAASAAVEDIGGIFSELFYADVHF